MTTSFQNLGLTAELLRAVTEQGYTIPTPIQAQAIPVVLAGKDLLGAAQTGTGKTAGFTLPMLQLLGREQGAAQSTATRHPRALVLVPTRELAAQVQDSVRVYGRYVKLRSTVIYGGVGFTPQATELRRGIDIVVATPGRLLDHVQQRTIDLRHIEILVLDEADRMLDMGFLPDIRRILALLPAKRQNLLFSATFSDDIRRLAGTFQHDPVTVEVARRYEPIELITQVVHPVDKDRKRELLSHLVNTNNWQQVLVFTKTKHGANRLTEQLGHDGIQAEAIHGNKSQPARTRALKRFKDMELQVLVATDIAGRGIDINALPHVVNYDLPHVPEDYVHRIGRTGRAGTAGEAVSLVCGEDRPLLNAIERLIARQIDQRVIAGFEPTGRISAGGNANANARAPRSAPRHNANGARYGEARRPQQSQGRPEQSQRRTEQGQRRTEQGQRRTEQGQRRTEQGQRRTEQGQGRSEQRYARPQQHHEATREDRIRQEQSRGNVAASPVRDERPHEVRSGNQERPPQLRQAQPARPRQVPVLFGGAPRKAA
ncbi:MAG: DEAD/DEAH box helicase [Betaproteobacteria bacterium]|nr:DEAD/DEAH box helicase [Betaproteobacteria bacterium]